MFDALSERLGSIFDGLTGRGHAGAGKLSDGECRGQGATVGERDRRVRQAECGLNGRE